MLEQTESLTAELDRIFGLRIAYIPTLSEHLEGQIPPSYRKEVERARRQYETATATPDAERAVRLDQHRDRSEHE